MSELDIPDSHKDMVENSCPMDRTLQRKGDCKAVISKVQGANLGRVLSSSREV